jgi:hypothetical protein
MVSVDFATFRLVGIYMPNLRAKIPYWEALIATLSSQSANRALAIGDFNTCRAYLDGSASIMPSYLRSWPLAPAPSTIPMTSGSPGSPITRP